MQPAWPSLELFHSHVKTKVVEPTELFFEEELDYSSGMMIYLLKLYFESCSHVHTYMGRYVGM